MGIYLGPDIQEISEQPPNRIEGEVYFKRNVIILSTAVDAASAETFETNVGKLVIDECSNSFPNFTSVPNIKLTPLGDYDLVVVPTAIDATSDKINAATSGHTFKVYIGNVGTVPSDATYRTHMEWTKC